MDNDDAPVGRILSRRELLVLFGAAGAGAVAVACGGKSTGSSATSTPPRSTGTSAAGGSATRTPTAAGATGTAPAGTPTVIPSCVVVPQLTQGPYFVDEKLKRSDIRTDSKTGVARPGIPLVVTFNVSAVNGSSCVTLPGADVDIWHCDAAGAYSDATDPAFNTRGQDWLRGYQTTDDAGVAKFTTIYPGWYQGRAVHIHFKVRGAAAAGSSYEFTSQLFFEEATTDIVQAQPPYAAKGVRTLKNEGDGIYRQSAGKTLMPVTKTADGYAGTFDIGIQGAGGGAPNV